MAQNEGRFEFDELAKRMPWYYREPGTVEGNRSAEYEMPDDVAEHAFIEGAKPGLA